MSQFPCHSRLAQLVLVCISPLICGCGTSGYEARMDGTLKEHRKEQAVEAAAVPKPQVETDAERQKRQEEEAAALQDLQQAVKGARQAQEEAAEGDSPPADAAPSEDDSTAIDTPRGAFFSTLDA